MSKGLSKNQKICFWSLYICFCLAMAYSIFEQEGWGDADGAVYVMVWAICFVSAGPIYYWVYKNPKTVDKLFE